MRLSSVPWTPFPNRSREPSTRSPSSSRISLHSLSDAKLYEGIPRTEYAADWGFVPNKITLFSNALLEDFPDPSELEHEVWITVVHELAHHLGIEEGRLHELGVD